jgi:tetratricopeptide (TPR) repeat protein
MTSDLFRFHRFDIMPSNMLGVPLIPQPRSSSSQAIAEEERAVALDPNNASTYIGQADVFNLAGRPEEALRALAHVMRLSPSHLPPSYAYELAWAYRTTGRYAEAISALQEFLSRKPDSLAANTHLALNYLLQWLAQQSPTGQTLEPALTALHRALALNDAHHWSHLALGAIYLYQHQYEQALAETERGVALAPAEAGAYAALAVVLSCMGRTEEALEAAAQALRLKPLIQDDHLGNVGTAYAVAGRYEEARAPLQRYLARYPNYLPAHLTLAFVDSELGQATEAQKEAAEVLRLNPKFSLEVHKQRMPIKDPALLERHIAALRKAGLK